MLLNLPESLLGLLSLLKAKGKNSYLVGGAVRDGLLARLKGAPQPTPKDFDIEVYGATMDELKDILNPLVSYDAVGKQFGVLKLGFVGFDVDLSLPRRDSQKGSGHMDIEVETDPHMSFIEACGRRNHTINAIMWDPVENVIIDELGGMRDLYNGVIKAPSPKAYAEDPLRPLVSIQQACRFGFKIDPATAYTCREMQRDGAYEKLPGSRIMEEWLKIFEKGTDFELLFQSLYETGWLKCYPELENVYRLVQDPNFHPEGDVHTHSALAAEWMTMYCDQNAVYGEDRIVLVAAAFCHDLGKSLCSEDELGRLDNTRPAKGKVTSYKHEIIGVSLNDDTPGPITTFLERISMPNGLKLRILDICREHMLHHKGALTQTVVRRAAARMKYGTLGELYALIYADHASRPPLPAKHPCPEMLGLITALKLENDRPKPILMGQHLLDWGYAKPGPAMGKILKEAFEAQLDGRFVTLDGAHCWLVQNNYTVPIPDLTSPF